MKNKYKLSKDEELLWIKHPSIIILLSTLIPVVVGIVGLFLIINYSGMGNTIVNLIIGIVGAFIFLVILISWLKTKYILTTKKVASQIGVLGSKYEEISFSDVQGVDLVQTFWGMIFGYGTLVVEAAGAHNFVKFDSISNVKKIEKQISQLSSP